MTMSLTVIWRRKQLAIDIKKETQKAIDRNEIFYFYVNENPLKVDDKISGENSIITVTVFLTLLRLLCKKPLMGRMMKKEKNLTGKVKGKIVIEKKYKSKYYAWQK